MNNPPIPELDDVDHDELIRQAMRLLGSRTSERKTKSCRLNAKRPRKSKYRKTAKNLLTTHVQPNSGQL